MHDVVESLYNAMMGIYGIGNTISALTCGSSKRKEFLDTDSNPSLLDKMMSWGDDPTITPTCYAYTRVSMIIQNNSHTILLVAHLFMWLISQ